MREIHLQRKRKDNHQNALSKIVLQHCEAQGEKITVRSNGMELAIAISWGWNTVHITGLKF